MGALILRLLLWQFVSACVVSASLFFVVDWEAAVSALIGSAACAVPNTYFVLRMWYVLVGSKRMSRTRDIYVGVLAKILMSAALLVTPIFMLPWLAVPALMAGFIVTQFVNWMALASEKRA